jgi:hypothetical protein
LVAKVKRGYFRIKYQMPAQAAVAVIQTQPRKVIRFMGPHIASLAGRRID